MPNAATELLRLILVDDDRERAAAVADGLGQVGFTVISVIPTAAGLLYQMSQHEPDAVIIALDSPDRDVLDSLSVVSSHNPRPVVMFSEAGDKDFITDAIRAGVTAYQAEDINPVRVRAAVDVAMAQFTTYNELKCELSKTRRQLEERKLIEKAKGMLMDVHKIAENEAFATLRKLAMDRNRTLGETAQEVVEILSCAGTQRRRA